MDVPALSPYIQNNTSITKFLSFTPLPPTYWEAHVICISPAKLLASGQRILIQLQNPLNIISHGDLCIQYIRVLGKASQIKVAVVGQISHGVLGWRCTICDLKRVAFGDRIGYGGLHFAGIALITSRAGKIQLNASRALWQDGHVPDLFIEAMDTTMQSVGTVIDGELMRSAVDGKLPFADAYVRGQLLVSARKPA